MTLKPRPAFVFSDGFEAPADCILADDLLHAQKLGQNRIVPQRRDVGVTLVSGQNRERRCAEHIALLRRVRARIGEWTIGYERVEQARNLEIFDEKGQL